MQTSLFTTPGTSQLSALRSVNASRQGTATAMRAAAFKATPSSYTMMSSSIGKMQTPSAFKNQGISMAASSGFFGQAPNAMSGFSRGLVGAQANKYSVSARTSAPTMMIG
jgi:hypothetical protein